MYEKKLLSLEDARIVGEAALAKAMENPERPMAIAVTDATSELVYFVKMDNSNPLFGKMAVNKAYTAATFGMDTAIMAQAFQADNISVSSFGDPRYTTGEGGVCLRAPDGSVLGAIGTSGRAPKIDKYTDLDIAMAGAKALP